MMAIDAAFVWCVRLLLATLLIGAVSLLAALVLLVRDAEADLRRALGDIAMWAFGSLGLLLTLLFVLVQIRRISRVWRNLLFRRRSLVPGRPGENQDSVL
jgi:hypothetical protein